jgi:Flp pilus assembly protein TadG
MTPSRTRSQHVAGRFTSSRAERPSNGTPSGVTPALPSAAAGYKSVSVWFAVATPWYEAEMNWVSGRTASSGQALVEMALLLPLLAFVVGLAFTGSSFLSTVIGLNGAARAGVIAVVNDADASPPISTYSAQVADAVAAANNEQGCTACIVASNDLSSCGATSNCLWIDTSITSGSGKTIDVVHVSYIVSSYVPLLASMRVEAKAGLEP